MSCTELYGLTKNSVVSIGETHNAWRGGMAIWMILEKKYLPRFIPSWAINRNEEYSRTSCMFDGNNEIQKIWDLSKSEKLTESEKIVLCTTFDNALVKVENVNKLISAFREFDKEFEGKTTLSQQADIIEREVKKDKDIVAIGWNQTSVNGDTWASENYDEEKDEYIGYNLETGERHWFLIEEIEKEAVVA